jgi:putative nucleotidyltransferase-like protein
MTMQLPTGTLNGYDFYRRVMENLNTSGVPFLVGGAQMLERYAGITRDTKDLDLYLRPRDVKSALEVLSAAGYKTEMVFPHWLAKVYEGTLFVDIIFGSGNGICEINEAWFEHSMEGEVFETPIRYCPPEEMIWSKAFIMERERFDGADIAHLVRSCAERMDWQRLLRQFEPHWRVLFSHLVIFGFIYPTERTLIPVWVMGELVTRLRTEMANPAPEPRLCQGTLLSRVQYLKDITDWGYQDARLQPFGTMTPEEAMQWTAGADQSNSSEMNATFNVYAKGGTYETK